MYNYQVVDKNKYVDKFYEYKNEIFGENFSILNILRNDC